MRFPGLSLLLLLAVASLKAAPVENEAARTVILVNSSQPESVALGEFYAEQRGIPVENLIALPMPAAEEITWHQFVDEIWQPLQDELLRRHWLEGVTGQKTDRLGRRQISCSGQRIAYLVTCRGTPLRIQHDPTMEPVPKPPTGPMDRFRTNQGAVDSELSLLATGSYEISGFLPNPLYASNRSRLAAADLIIRVSRLDGPTDASARHLVTSAIEAEQRGLIGRSYVDLVLNGAPHPDGDRWLEAAARLLEQAGFDGAVDRNPGIFDQGARFDAPAVYLGWYTGRVTGPFLRPGFQFPAGAIAVHIYSYSAATLRSETEGWCGPLIARGVAATVGNVYEPYLQMLHRPDLLMQALLRGDTLGDAAYFALPFLSWQSIVIGDPLYRPFSVSVEEQRRQLAQLPAEIAPYVVLREARLLEQAGKAADAAAIRQAGARRYPGIVIALAQAQSAMSAKAPAAAAMFIQSAWSRDSSVVGERWPVWREAAQLLLQAGAPGEALRICQTLIQEGAPTPAVLKSCLDEAIHAAESAGDKVLAEKFKAQLEPPPPVLPAAVRPEKAR